MKRAEIDAPNTPLVIRTYEEVPKPQPGGLVVKTKFCGICHSDVHLAEGNFDLGGGKVFTLTDDPAYTYPRVFGHEIAGEIASLGTNEERKTSDEDDLKVGDKVVVYPWMGCNKCPLCDIGDGNMCVQAIGTAIGVGVNGGFSEYVPVSRRDYVVKVPKNLSLDVACMLACSGLTAYNALSKIKPTIERFLKVTGKASLLIVGAGGLGLWSLQIARAYLPKGTKILIADINRGKLENATAAGVDDTVFWDPALSEADQIAMTKSKGDIHAAVDFVNSPQTSERVRSSVAKGGAIAMVGLFGGSTSISLPLFALGLYQLFGVYVGTLEQLKELMQLVSAVGIKPPNLSYVTLSDVSGVLEKLKRGEITGRALVRF